MLFAVVALCLFGWGALGLFGYWRLVRTIEDQGAAIAQRLEGLDRTERKLGELAGSLYHLGLHIEAQRLNAQALRVKLDTFIDGPPSLRTPPAWSGTDSTSDQETSISRP